MSGATPASVVILISGRGSNMQALLEASRGSSVRGGVEPFRIALVLSDRPGAPGLDIARNYGVPARVLAAGPLDRVGYDRSLAQAIEPYRPSLIVLAGFMRILSPWFVERHAGRILNIHPSLLPKYAGLHTHRRAIAAGDACHGATVHFVTAELDGGPPILQGSLDVRPEDTEATLAARVLSLEHRMYPLAVMWFCAGRLELRDGRALFDGHALNAPLAYETAAEHGESTAGVR